MIEFEFFDLDGTILPLEVTRNDRATGTVYVATVATNPRIRHEAPSRAEAVAALRKQLTEAAEAAKRDVEEVPPPTIKPKREPRPLTKLGRPGRVLVVDDNPQSARLVIHVCRMLGHDAVGAKDGMDAWWHVQVGGGPIDLVITDLHMPGVTGFQLVSALRTTLEDGGPPVIAVTAGGPNARDAIDSLGADEVIRKPYEPRDLMDAIKRLIEI